LIYVKFFNKKLILKKGIYKKYILYIIFYNNWIGLQWQGGLFSNWNFIYNSYGRFGLCGHFILSSTTGAISTFSTVASSTGSTITMGP